MWLLRPFARKNQAAWEHFFDLLPGTPQRIVADMDAAIGATFPRRGHRAPDFQWSDLHVRRALDNALAPLHGQPAIHPLLQGLEHALFSASKWGRFVGAVEHEDRRGTPLPGVLRWIRMSSALRLPGLLSNAPGSRGPCLR